MSKKVGASLDQYSDKLAWQYFYPVKNCHHIMSKISTFFIILPQITQTVGAL